MIEAKIYKTPLGQVKSFSVKNHAESNVCAAVSMLTLNTVNSIETFTDAEFTCEFSEDGGFLTLTLSSINNDRAGLLLDAMVLGLTMASEEYPSEVSVQLICPDQFNESE